MTATQRAVVDDFGNINVHGRSALQVVWKVKDAEGTFLNISASDLFIEIAGSIRVALTAGEDDYSRKLSLTRAQIAALPLNQPLSYALHDETPSSAATIWSGKITAYGFRAAPPGADAVEPGTASWTGATVTVMQGESVPTVVVTYMGATGYGVPTGGTVGQYLRKASATNFDTAWDTITADDVSGLSASLSTLTSADASLTSRVSTEETTRATADTSLTTRLSTEEAARGSADTSIVTRFSTADTSLATAAAATYLPLAGGVMTGVLAFLAGTAALPGLAVAGDLNTGIYGVSADVMGVSAGGVAVQTWGVGTSTLTGHLLRGADNTYDDGALGANRVRNYYAGTSFIAPLGAVGTPSYSFTGDANTGFWSPAADTWAASAGGVETIRGVSGLVTVATKLSISGVNLGSVALDVFTNTAGTIAALQSNALAANETALTLNLGNSITGSATALFMQAAVSSNWITQLYNSGAGGAKYHALVAGAATGDPYITFEINGGGAWSAGLDNSDSDAFLISQWSTLGTNNRLRIATDGVATLYNNVLASADNTYDIGASGANRPRNIYAAGSITQGSGSFTTLIGTSGVQVTTPSGSAAYFRLTQTGVADSYLVSEATTGALVLQSETGVVEVKRTTQAQTLRVYNTYTDSSNFERLALDWSANIAYLRTQKAGTGADRSIVISATASTYIGGGGSYQWLFGDDGNFYPNADATTDAGGAAKQIRDLYLSRRLMVGGAAPAGAAGLATVQGFGQSFALIGGTITTDAADKGMRIGGLHYLAAEEPLGALFTYSSASASVVAIGGGSSSMNAATQVDIYTAANTTTTTGTARWQWNSAGHYLASADNTYDIGASGSSRPRNVYLGGSLFVGSYVGWSGGTRMIGSLGADGELLIANSTVSDFLRLQFGGTGASHPALRRTGTSLEVVLANNSAYTGFNADSITAATNRAIAAGGIAGVGFKLSTTANFGVFFGSGAPTISAAKGSLYLRSDGSGTSDRMYVNTDGATAWTAVTTAA
jgi:hypothetical protein